MTVQLIGITHRDSEIKQAIFLDWDADQKMQITLQATSPAAWGLGTQHSKMTKAQALEFVDAYADAEAEGALTITYRDACFDSYRASLAAAVAGGR